MAKPTGNPNGRPPTYKTAEEMQEVIDIYIESVSNAPTITGLALSLGFCSRQSIYDYIKKEEFSYTLKRAVLYIENFYETCLTNPTIKTVAGPIFALKNLGWEGDKEKSEDDDKNKEGEISDKEIIDKIKALTSK